jgi:hypothetical protein
MLSHRLCGLASAVATMGSTVPRALRQALPGGGSYWDGRRLAPTSLCPPAWGRRGQTRCVRCALSAQTMAASQKRSAHLRARPQAGGHSRPKNRPHRTAPAAAKKRLGIPPVVRQHLFCQGVRGQAAARLVRRREAQWPWPRAQRASLSDSSHLSERRERQRTQRVVRRATAASIAGESVHRTDRLAQALRPAHARLGGAVPRTPVPRHHLRPQPQTRGRAAGPTTIAGRPAAARSRPAPPARPGPAGWDGSGRPAAATRSRRPRSGCPPPAA